MESESDELCRSACSHLRSEIETIRREFEEGELVDYRERVILSRKLDAAMSRAAPYARKDGTARELTREAEELRKRLLSVKDIILIRPS